MINQERESQYISHRKSSYQFNDISSKNFLHRINFSIISWCILKSWKIMLPNEVFHSILHWRGIQVIGTVIGMLALKRVHDRVIIYLVMINFAFWWKTSMELLSCWTDFPDTYFWRKEPIQCCMKAFQAVIQKWCNKMCHLKSWWYTIKWKVNIYRIEEYK